MKITSSRGIIHARHGLFLARHFLALILMRSSSLEAMERPFFGGGIGGGDGVWRGRAKARPCVASWRPSSCLDPPERQCRVLNTWGVADRLRVSTDSASALGCRSSWCTPRHRLDSVWCLLGSGSTRGTQPPSCAAPSVGLLRLDRGVFGARSRAARRFLAVSIARVQAVSASARLRLAVRRAASRSRA